MFLGVTVGYETDGVSVLKGLSQAEEPSCSIR
jgi:hypothetical protein